MLPDTASGLRVAALCAGYGGLEMAVLGALDGQVVVGAEVDPHAAAVFAHHHPGVPNLGDITRADWRAVRELYRPDAVVAGFPCRNISNAGRKDGISGQWSRVWKNVAAAVRVLEPRIVFLENVAALCSRGLDVVAGDLAQVGYDARWTCVRAGDPEVGAPHQRDRWFAVAHPADAHPDEFGRQWRTGDLPQTQGRDEPAHRRDQAPAPRRLRLLPTPAARDWKSGASNLLDRNARPLNEFAVNVLAPLDGRWVTSDGVDYGPAIRRWETILGRPAPAPTMLGPRGGVRLAPRFTEWLMGLPDGHVTGLGLGPKAELTILGNGVVPRQASWAYGQLLGAQQAVPAGLPLAA
ncbi:DNA cytosine methyltransferase [Streptomyces sp. NRRL S-495]|uniref:DNA cytosine methyltransferase n=1 Tax=Streptomyces sp. NRRL S-495 TaxID=1609133 RepID=UPI000696ECCC|nr:DNA cytosine methyltransferase [Streptomyces sp. NRRL S-495]